ncbi:elongator complex protein 3 [Natronincola ferrireducens]|uniref:Radical SAM superfamily protein n=1 Tax=Natronincola ferrireducens TaxID=393762 RepID=A0A1G9BXP1_9FIRM|nr:radical SAM protein [Natronincola ferrireducens]SDK44219.1 Radical SAM superfamily protein [Natronincola ferrireducens]
MSKKLYIIPIFIPHKGCPHDCSFCNQKKIAGEIIDVTCRDVDRIIHHYLNLFSEQAKTIEVAFYGGSFTGLSKEKQIELLKPAFDMKKKGIIHSIRLSTRPDYIDTEILENLKEYGVSTIELGLQSTDDNILLLNNRGHTRDEIVKAAVLIKDFQFKLGLQMMVGLLGDNRQTIDKTAEDIILLKPDFVRVYPTVVIQDTYLEKLYYKGKYRPFTLGDTVEICKDLLLKFEEKDIPVIRLGLQSTEDIQQGKAIIAGPYHPAFREIVESEIYKDRIETKLKNKQLLKEAILTVYCHPKVISKIAGFKQCNKLYFINKYSLYKMIIKSCDNMETKDVKVEITVQ